MATVMARSDAAAKHNTITNDAFMMTAASSDRLPLLSVICHNKAK
jgi:hypothetical protein